MPPRRRTVEDADYPTGVEDAGEATGVEFVGSPPRAQRSLPTPSSALRQQVLAGTAAAIAGKVAGLGGHLDSEQASRIARAATLVANAVTELEEGA